VDADGEENKVWMREVESGGKEAVEIGEWREWGVDCVIDKEPV